VPQLTPWWNWNQLNDWTADGLPDKNRLYNCGPESVAECLKYLTGVELPADYIKDVMYGEGYVGETDVPHMVSFLQDRCQVPCEVHSGDANTLLQPLVRQAIDDGNPIIVLFFFTLNDPSSGHFSPVVAYDETGCTRSNTWNGLQETWDWATFEKWQKLGNCVLLLRTRAADLPASPDASSSTSPGSAPTPKESPEPVPPVTGGTAATPSPTGAPTPELASALSPVPGTAATAPPASPTSPGQASEAGRGAAADAMLERALAMQAEARPYYQRHPRHKMVQQTKNAPARGRARQPGRDGKDHMPALGWWAALMARFRRGNKE
jgi:hypothetical protein